MQNIKTKMTAGAALALASAASFAQTVAPTSAAQLADSVNLGDMTTALFAIAGLILGFTVVAKGVSLVIGFVRRG